MVQEVKVAVPPEAIARPPPCVQKAIAAESEHASGAMDRDTVEFDHARTRQDGTVITELRFALWLAIGTLVPSQQVKTMRIQRYLVGPERLGAALDAALATIAGSGAIAVTVLRAALLHAASTLRALAPNTFTVQGADMYDLETVSEIPLLQPAPAAVAIADFTAADGTCQAMPRASGGLCLTLRVIPTRCSGFCPPCAYLLPSASMHPVCILVVEGCPPRRASALARSSFSTKTSSGR